MFSRIWSRIRKWASGAPCARCGKPAVGLWAPVRTIDRGTSEAGKPFTNLTFKRAEMLCRDCLDDEQW